jgi:hypothetical protein
VVVRPTCQRSGHGVGQIRAICMPPPRRA